MRRNRLLSVLCYLLVNGVKIALLNVEMRHDGECLVILYVCVEASTPFFIEWIWAVKECETDYGKKKWLRMSAMEECILRSRVWQAHLSLSFSPAALLPRGLRPWWTEASGAASGGGGRVRPMGGGHSAGQVHNGTATVLLVDFTSPSR